MMISHIDVRNKYKTLLEKNGHKEVPAAPLTLFGDSTTLFTNSGMQQFVPYLLGETHPLGTKLYDIQPCIRSQDIEEVGDNRHTTFFEMMGNWSLGEYFKKEQLRYFFEFLTDKHTGLGIDPHRLYVSVFEGDKNFTIKPNYILDADMESVSVWRAIFEKSGIDVNKPQRIYFYPSTKNWWSRAGTPQQMPIGEPGGPDSEVFYDFGEELKLHESSPYKDQACHPNCDCGRFMEIGNSVFMQYKKVGDNLLEELPNKNVDFGGGLERLLAAANNTPDVFNTDLFEKIISAIEDATNKSYSEVKNQPSMRIIADHIKAATFLIYEGVQPSNKEHGYILRRLLRRAAVKLKLLNDNYDKHAFSVISRAVLTTYKDTYFKNISKDEVTISLVIDEEMKRFFKSLENGLKEIKKIDYINGKQAFDLYQSHGFPLEITEEIFKEKGQNINREEFYAEFNKHKELSRSASAGMFKGGLADQSEQTVRYHTATHLLHQSLFDILGPSVRQEGSNITGERLRFDFAADRKLTDEELKNVEKNINDKIAESLPVNFKIMPKEEANKVGAKSFFREKYPDMVKVYYIGDNLETAYSKEFCGGPHVGNTKEIGKIEIYKLEKIGSNLFRIYAR